MFEKSSSDDPTDLIPEEEFEEVLWEHLNFVKTQKLNAFRQEARIVQMHVPH